MPLAAGGMARIYIGRSTGIGSFERHVVLKMITPERANDQVAVNMFLDEARLAASLNHQNVAQVFEVGEDVGIHYLAMEYVHGQDLRAVLAKAGSQGTRIPLELALTVVAGAAAGLHHAHERRGPDGVPLGIVHRDVSPSNLMIGYDGAVKLLDFGIAKATARSVETQSGIIKGKFAYMAPEQCRGRDVDRRSDVFSLGIILYEISTQHRCFRADSDFDTMHRIVTGDVVRPTRLVQGYPQALEAIVMKALAIDAAQRYQSSGLLLEALESFAVASRMSLSTMGLGRFMRDMFGEVQEPWLNTAATKVLQPMAPKESTISSTDGKGSTSQPVVMLDVNDSGIPDDDARFADSDDLNSAAATSLDLPRNAGHNARAPDEWSPRGYPLASRNQSLTDKLLTDPPLRAPFPPPAAIAAQSASHAHPVLAPPEMLPATPPSGVQQMMHPAAGTYPPPHADLPLPAPPQAQFNVPGSGSGPAHAAMGAVGAHGYPSATMARGDVSYPRYEVPLDALAPDVQLTPNRRPLLIGLGIVVVGIIVLLAVAFSGDPEGRRIAKPADNEPEQMNESDRTQSMPEMPPPPAKGSADEITIDSMVSIVIYSEPSGADVLIAGTKVGVTPFESKLKRGTKIAQLTVQKAGYAPFQGKIDLGGEYENKHINLVPLEEVDETAGSASEQGSDEPVDKATPDKSSDDKATARPDKGTKSTPEKTRPVRTSPTRTNFTPPRRDRDKDRDRDRDKEREKCQPPGPNVDPFGAPVCKV